jgi:hypothetical protein
MYDHYLVQTLKTLLLCSNESADQGTEYLADALQMNKVREVFHSFTLYSGLLFDTDAH